MQGSIRRLAGILWQREAALLLLFWIFASCSQRPTVIVHADHGTVTIPVEIADTPDARARGLMYRRDLAADAGMLFVFPTPGEQRFWMKNTPLSLDMIFIGSDHRIIGVIPDARPFSTDHLTVEGLSQYVLEVHGGFCAAHGIAPGNQVDLIKVQEGGE